MKPFYKFSLVALAVLGLAACNQEQKTAASDTNVQLNTDTQKEAYSVGASIGRYMAGHIKEQEELGIPVDRDLIVAGFKQGLDGKIQLKDDEMQKILEALDKKVNDKRQTKAKEVSEKNLKDGQSYLEQNKNKAGVKTTESGLQYEVLQEGTGAKPKAEDTVKVKYKGMLIDGTEFDSTEKHGGEPIEFPLNRVIPGWTEGVQLMSVGAKYRFVIPAELAYGDRDMGTIPANSTLIFEVELLGITPAAEAEKPAADASK
ncbi:FKBP-type peptidyl-prolyl cis-trans isomerase [Shewanella fodinae]|uniref:Peptidyl-prolyl cis-trans isomerase n=1 Tax=Shewanella fodinae TaxID=552357 RepID=A0A4V2RRW2_9GAMM|nr:FKBP-type peptidyl-prolyl cis-trans isomerase [Shewanella fodinae]TCN81362.1 FKBP-type peptidyl-prolyl cis-trans isomerase FkpA [Shewanella fodinae]